MPDDQPAVTYQHNESGAVDPPVFSCEIEREPDRYREELSELNLSREQENAIIEALFQIMSTFVDLGWGVDTVQLLFPELFKNIAKEKEELLDSNEAEKNRKE